MAEVGSFVLVVGVGDFDLRLLRITAVGVARFQLFEVLDGLFVVAVGQIDPWLRRRVSAPTSPGFILDFRQQAAAGYQQCKN